MAYLDNLETKIFRICAKSQLTNNYICNIAITSIGQHNVSTCIVYYILPEDLLNLHQTKNHPALYRHQVADQNVGPVGC